MGIRGLGYFFRIAAVLAVMCVIVVFFTEPGSAEFYITVISGAVSLGLGAISAVLIIRERNRKDK